MKFFNIILLLVSCCAINVYGQMTEYGRRETNDELIHLEIITKKYMLYNILNDGEYRFPEQQPINEPIKITFVRTLDLWDNGSTAVLVGGGPDKSYVQLHFKSKPFKGYSYLVEIYGHKFHNIDPQKI